MSAWRHVLACSAAALAVLLGAPPAAAHSASTAYVEIERGRDAATTVRWRIALRDLDVLLDVDADDDGRLRWREVLDRATAIEALARDRLRLAADDVACALRFDAPQFRREAELGYLQLDARGDCAATALHYEVFANVDPTHRALVRIDGAAPQVIAPGQSLVLPPGATTPAPGIGAFVREGIGHILGGLDHLLFLVALMLPAVVRRSGSTWVPRSDRRAALVDVAWLATAFTLAHSLTLACATFGWMRISPSIVEPLVAATVLAAALNNLWPVVTRRLAAVAFAFGLVHGFAFAEVLAPLDLPRAALARALFGFNVGVETGQLLVVGASFALVAAAARWHGYATWVLRGGSTAVALLAVGWLLERTLPGLLI